MISIQITYSIHAIYSYESTEDSAMEYSTSLTTEYIYMLFRSVTGLAVYQM